MVQLRPPLTPTRLVQLTVNCFPVCARHAIDVQPSTSLVWFGLAEPNRHHRHRHHHHHHHYYHYYYIKRHRMGSSRAQSFAGCARRAVGSSCDCERRVSAWRPDRIVGPNRTERRTSGRADRPADIERDLASRKATELRKGKRRRVPAESDRGYGC